MGLEFLLRRTPPWREVAEGILLREGDIVEQGQEAEERAVEGATARGAPVTGSASLVSPCRTPSGRDRDAQIVAHFLPHFGAKRLDEITKSDIVRYLNLRRTPMTVNPGHKKRLWGVLIRSA